MRKFQCLLFMLKRSYICYYIICMTLLLNLMTIKLYCILDHIFSIFLQSLHTKYSIFKIFLNSGRLLFSMEELTKQIWHSTPSFTTTFLWWHYIFFFSVIIRIKAVNRYPYWLKLWLKTEKLYPFTKAPVVIFMYTLL